MNKPFFIGYRPQYYFRTQNTCDTKPIPQWVEELLNVSRNFTKEEAIAHSKVLENRSVVKGNLYDISSE